MKGLALDYVILLIILLATALVVISLVVYFSDSIKRFIQSKTSGNKIEAQTIEATSFSTEQLATYARACWDKTGENYREDAVCYILRGDMSSVDTAALESLVSFPLEANFDPSKNIVVVKYAYIGHKIVMEN